MGFVPVDLGELMRAVVRSDQGNALFLLPSAGALVLAQPIQLPNRGAFRIGIRLPGRYLPCLDGAASQT